MRGSQAGESGGRLPVLPPRLLRQRGGVSLSLCRGPNHLSSLGSASPVYAAPPGRWALILSPAALPPQSRAQAFHTAPPVPRAHTDSRAGGRVRTGGGRGAEGGEGPAAPTRGSDGRATAGPEKPRNSQHSARCGRSGPGRRPRGPGYPTQLPPPGGSLGGSMSPPPSYALAAWRDGAPGVVRLNHKTPCL